MGTSLSGLTPATTFDGLLKTSDNDAITSSLKTIGSGDGTDSCLQLSNSALRIGGDVEIETTDTWVDGYNSNLRLTANSPSIQFQDTSGTSGFMIGVTAGSTLFYQSSSADFSTTNVRGRLQGGNWTFGSGVSLGASVGIKGSGATSATTSLLVQNSVGDDVLKVTDDRKVIFNGDAEIDSSGISSLIVKRNGTELLKTDFSSANGALVFTGNLTNKFSLGVRGNDFNIWDGSYLGGGDLRFSILADGKTAIGAQTPTAQLHVKGSGATSATTSLLVQNSAGTELLKVTDNGAIDFGVLGIDFSNDGSGGTMSVAGDRYIRLASSLNTYSAFNAHVFKTFGSGGYSEAMRITGNTDQFVGIGETIPTAKLHVKGAGNTGATSSLLIQNSSASDLLRVNDSGEIRMQSLDFLGNKITSLARISTSGLAINNAGTSPDANTQLHIKGAGNTDATTSLLVQNSDGTDMVKVTDDGVTTIQGNVDALGGDVAIFQNNTDPTNQFKINKKDNSNNIWHTGTTNTEIQYRDNIHFRFNHGGVTQMQLRNTGNLGLGIGGSNASARMHVKGSGATSATTSLLVENSAGTDTLEVRDDGQINFNGNIYANADYKSIGRNSLNSIRFAGGETRVSVQGTSSANKFHVYASSTATSVFSVFTQTQQVGIGNGSNSLDGTAKLQIDSTTQGFLPPRMTGTQRDAIEEPASGLIIYNTTTNKAQCYNGTSWNDMF